MLNLDKAITALKCPICIPNASAFGNNIVMDIEMTSLNQDLQRLDLMVCAVNEEHTWKTAYIGKPGRIRVVYIVPFIDDFSFEYSL